MVERTREEVARIIHNFLDGTGKKWDWDDFCSLPIKDAELNRIRDICCNLGINYPPTQNGHYTSATGIEVLAEIARKLQNNEPVEP